MTGLLDDYPAGESESRCYRDYEGDIAKLKAKINLYQNLKDSVEVFVEKMDSQIRRNEKFSLPELFGILTFDIRGMTKKFELLMKEWETELAKKKPKVEKAEE